MERLRVRVEVFSCTMCRVISFAHFVDRKSRGKGEDNKCICVLFNAVSRHKRAHKVVTRACSDPCADFVVCESPRPRERRNKIKLCSSLMMT